jgi:hypothetical protein
MDYRDSNFVGSLPRTIARPNLSYWRDVERCSGDGGRGFWILGGMEDDARRMILLFLLRIADFVTVGALLGSAYLAVLGFNARLYVKPAAVWIAVLIHILRIFVIGAAFTFCAYRGAPALISSVAGFHIVRTIVINWQTVAPAKS